DEPLVEFRGSVGRHARQRPPRVPGRRRADEDKEMRIATFATGVCLALLGTISLAQSVTSDHDGSAKLSSYKTYAWTGNAELSGETDHARVVRAVDVAPATTGLARVDPGANPDVLVAYHVGLERDLQTVESGSGGLGGRRWGSMRVRPILVGTLVVQ